MLVALGWGVIVCGRGVLTPPALGGEVFDGTDGVGPGERVLVLDWSPSPLGRGVTGGVGNEIVGDLVLVALGWGVSISMCVGAGVMASLTVGSMVLDTGADVDPGTGDGARASPYSSSVNRCFPSQLHCSTEDKSLIS